MHSLPSREPKSPEKHQIVFLGPGLPHGNEVILPSDFRKLDIDITEAPASDGRELSISVSGSPAEQQALEGTSVSLVRYIDVATTHVTRGENMDPELANHHIVYEVSTLSDVNAEQALNVVAAAPIPGEGCVVIVQKNAVSPVYAIAECP